MLTGAGLQQVFGQGALSEAPPPLPTPTYSGWKPPLLDCLGEISLTNLWKCCWVAPITNCSPASSS